MKNKMTKLLAGSKQNSCKFLKNRMKKGMANMPSKSKLALLLAGLKKGK